MANASSKRQPLQLHLESGKKHLTNADKEARADAEITMGRVEFNEPLYVRANKEAHKKWKEITRIYKQSGLFLVTSTDNGVLARYCLIWSEYLALVKKRKFLNQFKPPDDIGDLDNYLEIEFGRERAAYLWKTFDFMISLNGLIKLDASINAKLKSLLDIEDRIFLNPASKVRSLPIRRKPKQKDKLADMGFDV